MNIKLEKFIVMTHFEGLLCKTMFDPAMLQSRDAFSLNWLTQVLL